RCGGVLGTVITAAVPLHRPFDRVVQAEDRLPSERSACLQRIQTQELSFVRRSRVGLNTQLALTPARHHTIRQFANTNRIFIVGTEVPRTRECLAVVPGALRHHQIAAQRFKHVLPGPYRLRPANNDGLTGRNAAHDIGHETVLGPVATADHVSGARRSYCRAVLREERAPVGGGDQLCRTLAGAVRIVAAHRVVLAISPEPFAVFIAFITRDHHNGPYRRRVPRGFEHVHRSHHVGCICLNWLSVGTPHQRLRRVVEHDFRRVIFEEGGHSREIADISEDGHHVARDACGLEETGFSVWWQRKADYARTQQFQPGCQPATFETAVAGHQDSFAAIEIGERIHAHYWETHGALPLAHNDSRYCLSRNVSIGCQNPV